MTLISCDRCGVVLNNEFSQIEHNETDHKIIFEYLKERKYLIYSYYADIEQTITTHIKWCPVCEEVKYFSNVEKGG